MYYGVQTVIILGYRPKENRPVKNAQYIIERVADFGHDDEVRWAWHFYDKSLLRKVIEKSRCLRGETKIMDNSSGGVKLHFDILPEKQKALDFLSTKSG